MSLVRRLLPNQAHAISRRCAGRCFFLVPDEWTTQLIGYCFAVANERYPSVRIHVFVAMSNHLEIVATDAHNSGKRSKVPRFFAYAHSLIAKAQNHRLGRGEHFWAPGSYRNTEIHDEAALLDRMVYALANPAAANLVETLDDWPGLQYGPEAWGQTFTFRRPPGAFFGGHRQHVPSPDPDVARQQREEERQRYAQELREARQALRDEGKTKKEAQRAAAAQRQVRKAKRERSRSRSRRTLPEVAKLRIVTPPSYRGRKAKAAQQVLRHLQAREAEHRATREREGKTVLGPEGVLAVDRLSSAGSTEADYSLSPVVACKDKERRKRVLKCLVGWRLRYTKARKQWPKKRNQKFPLGTYLMAVAHGAQVMSEKKALADELIAHPTGPPGSA